MKKILLLIPILFLVSCYKPTKKGKEFFKTSFEISDGATTPVYEEILEFYINLAQEYPEINIQTKGETDSGFPLHIVTYNIDGDFNFNRNRDKKNVILINNGIHPGESDGIDATMLLFRNLASNKDKAPKNTIIVTIPVYNIGGALQRNSNSRTNQNGPEEYGFRGNAQNYDLNRDFIKSDTKNAEAFAEIFHLIKPDVFIDNHVSNGADYQYTLTHLFTQHNKLGGEIGAYLHYEMMPQLEQRLLEKEWDMTPYVNVFNQPPDNGFTQFMDHPRYSTGYTTLWNTLGLMVETHMLKPYKQRVYGTYDLMNSVIDLVEKDNEKILELRSSALDRYLEMAKYPIKWEVDTTKFTNLKFKGYKVDTIVSEVTGFPRLKYDQNSPTLKEIPYSNYFIPAKEIEIPKAYIIKKGWNKVMKCLDLNEIEYTELTKDTTLLVESYQISDYKTYANPYEGHYPHYNTEVEKKYSEVTFSKGDYFLETNQEGIRYILETLEPEAYDSFFNWNFFDTILQQKEGFSPYVFEDLALKILNEDEALRLKFENEKASNESFNNDPQKQLRWIHKHSKYYEKAHLQYPVYRLLKN